MIPLNSNPNVDNSNLSDYPGGRIKDNDGSGNGTGVNRSVYGDLHSNISRLMRQYEIVPNGLPDNETNNYQIIQALSALASKNDYIYPLATNGTTTLSIDIKLSLMNNGEFLTCLASADKTTETFIKGSGPVSMAVVYSGDFKANEYVRVIKTVSGATIVRMADWNSLDAMCAELLFLKKASQAEENAGTSDLVATTPLVNKVAFARRVNGADSATYLATTSQHGLYPKTHFDIVAAIGASPVKNIGWFSVDPGASSGTVASGGDVTLATSTNISGSAYVDCTLAHAMDDTNYFVRIHVQGQGSDFTIDNRIGCPIFKPVSTTYLSIAIRDIIGGVQVLKVHIEVVQL